MSFISQQFLDLLREVPLGTPHQTDDGQHYKDRDQTQPEGFLEHSFRQGFIGDVHHSFLTAGTFPPGVTPAEESPIFRMAFAASLARVVFARFWLFIAPFAHVTGLAVALEAGLCQFAFSKVARLQFAHVQPAKPTGEVTPTLAHSTIFRLHDTLAAGLARIRFAAFDPLVLVGDQLHFVGNVSLQTDGGIQSDAHALNGSLADVQGVKVGRDVDGSRLGQVVLD